jgi:glycosyltransferase involved in cell wall biosynthesis
MMPQNIYHRVTRPVVVGRSRAIICASEKGRSFFVDQGTEPRKIFVANIVPAWSRPADIPGFAQRRHDLVWCGWVNDERKNWPFFVSLVLELKRRLPALSVRIIADSPSKPKELDQLSGAEVAFEYSPHIPPDEISSVFTTARVLALPSKSDAWGLVCNEAMQCGTPCIVSPFVGAAGELVVDDACGLVRPLEVEQWAAAISLLISDPVRWSGMSDAAMQAASQYSLNQSARRYVDGLNFAAARHPGRCARDGLGCEIGRRSASPPSCGPSL